MIVPPTGIRVLVATKPVDFRRGMDGLAAYVQQSMQSDPFSGVVYVFRAKRADRVKLLFWDGTGACLLSKRLEGSRFHWPAIEDGVMRLSPAQLCALLEGLDWSRVRMRRVARPHSDAVIHASACERRSATAAKSAILVRMALKIEDLPDDVALLKAMILAQRNEADAARAETARIDAEHARLAREHAALSGEVDRLTAQNERLDHIIAVLRRSQFGRSSERIDDDQLNLALEDVETGHGADDAKAEKANDIVRRKGIKGRRTNRGKLPVHLSREEIVIEPESTTCPCCGDTLYVIGDDTSERLDKVPAKLKVIVTRWPKYACRACETTGADETAGIIQAPAPLRLVEGGLPTEALVADVLVSKYADHLPLYRQAQIFAREGVAIDRSTLAHWVGFAAFELQPIQARLVEILKTSTKLFADETRCPVLDPGRGRTKTGYLWAIARDDRPWGGSDPPAVAYMYAPGRGAEHAVLHLAGFTGILQVDGYAAYEALTNRPRSGGPVTLAFCWSHFRRKFYDIAKAGDAPIATEALQRIGTLYEIEADIRGRSADQRRAERQARTKPIVDVLKLWLEHQLGRVSGRSAVAEAMRYGLGRREGLGSVQSLSHIWIWLSGVRLGSHGDCDISHESQRRKPPEPSTCARYSAYDLRESRGGEGGGWDLGSASDGLAF